MLLYRKFFWTRITCMEGLEEYAEEGSPLNEQSNSRKEPVKEEITNNSSELLQTVKELKTEMKTLKKGEWKNSKSSREVEPNIDGKFSNWRER